MRILILSQTYVPDAPAVGQYMHDAAVELARRGHDVVAVAASKSYEDSSQTYPKRETLDGVRVRRLGFSSFGKGSMAVRLLGGCSFTAQAALRVLGGRRFDVTLVSTSPPMAPLAALALRACRRTPYVFWAMDINPDQMVAMGKCAADSTPAWLFESMIRATLKHAARVCTLDRFMAERLAAKVPDAALQERLHVQPPWPMDAHLDPVPHAENPFRAEHGLDGKTVVMYSGNISDAHPIDAVLEAAERVRDADGLRFVFIGAGGGWQKIRDRAAERGLASVVTLPYQPLEKIRYSLSAADVHLVAMGGAMSGIVHPCKVYGVLKVHRPLLAMAPADSHVAEIADAGAGWTVAHDDADAAEALFRRLLTPAGRAELAEKSAAAAREAERFTRERMCAAFCDAVEAAGR
ncbi:glycosyltransferase family 4 protein [Phycisphaera mikurensis]|uniref:Putative glycosyltransferase n=1 Tax=Phycisphaera mikurensis (strain NBRC 102666 / KCTC 22515 / FYK2301M01) TaxID=1142394 RepID=I0IGR7_PHYMF|nr:glycosyltransferase family 4 protein [Phycisphaera mikurensis]MBB6443244.1 glycosyltransferase involved in cell wall biosynthesis [Phycisphaera mikurensis]BAM04455.1 putative glycosyltransferase [Phycisphaera mikurensis NBRC 102666]